MTESDPFGFLPSEWREKIREKVVIREKHWIWQPNAKNNDGKFTVKKGGKKFVVQTLLFALMFGDKVATVSQCDVERCVGPLCQRAKKWTPEERYANFLSSVTEPNENGCTFYIDDTKLRNVVDDRGLKVHAHVYVCDHRHPEFLENPLLTHVGHTCKSPVDENGHSLPNPCVTEGHLERVTPRENSLKKNEDGTMKCGNENGRTKITDDEVAKISSLLSAGKSVAELARIYSVDWKTIGSIRDGRRRVQLSDTVENKQESTNQKKSQGKDIPDKNDLLVAYFNLCRHQIYKPGSKCIKSDLSGGKRPVISVAGRIRQVSALIGAIKNNFTWISREGDLQGCHERFCDEKPWCTAFDHIRCDTRTRNGQDRITAERRQKVLDMFNAHKNGMTAKAVAIKFNESESTVQHLCNGTTYSWLTGVGMKTQIVEQTLLIESSPIASESTEDEPRYWQRRPLEIIYSAQKGLTLEQRAEKYQLSIEFMTELDKALKFTQPSMPMNGSTTFGEEASAHVKISSVETTSEQKVIKESKGKEQNRKRELETLYVKRNKKRKTEKN